MTRFHHHHHYHVFDFILEHFHGHHREQSYSIQTNNWSILFEINKNIVLFTIRSFRLWAMENILRREKLLLIRKMILQRIAIVILYHWFIEREITRNERRRWRLFCSLSSWTFLFDELQSTALNMFHCSLFVLIFSIDSTYFLAKEHCIVTNCENFRENAADKQVRNQVEYNQSRHTMEHCSALYFARKYFVIIYHTLHEMQNSISVSTMKLYWYHFLENRSIHYVWTQSTYYHWMDRQYRDYWSFDDHNRNSWIILSYQ